VTLYIGRHGTKRVANAVLISAIPSLLLKTGANSREFRLKCGIVPRRSHQGSIPVLQRLCCSSMTPTRWEPKCRRDCSIKSGY